MTGDVEPIDASEEPYRDFLRDLEQSPFKRGGVTIVKLNMRAEHPRQHRLEQALARMEGASRTPDDPVGEAESKPSANALN